MVQWDAIEIARSQVSEVHITPSSTDLVYRGRVSSTGYLFDQICRALAWSMTAAIVVVVAGCTVGPNYKLPGAALPTRWSGTHDMVAASNTTEDWWRMFGDQMLVDLMRSAIAGNLNVASSKAKIREARASRLQTIGGALPQVSGSGSALHERTATGATSVGPIEQDQFQLGLNSSLDLDIFGGNRRAIEAADYAVDASEDDLESVALTLLGEVANAYIDARTAQARIELARRSGRAQRETANLTLKKFEAGTASTVDVSKVEALAETTEANIPTFEQSYGRAVHRLGILLGRDPTGVAAQLRPVRPIPLPRSKIPVGIPADILLECPDVRRAERQLAQYTAKIGQAEAALYPSVSLTGSISTTAMNMGDLGKSSTIGWSIGPTLSVPIFNGGKLHAEVEVAQSQRDQYLISWESAVLTALEDVENALVSLSRERVRSSRLRKAVDQYREAARLSRSLYENGSTSFLDVLDADRSLYSASDSLLQSRSAIAEDFVALAKALGRGWKNVDQRGPETLYFQGRGAQSPFAGQ